MRLLSSTALVFLMFSQIASAQGKNDCSTIVTSAQDAANKADWVIEGTVSSMLRMAPSPNRISVFVENAKILYEAERSTRFSTAELETDSCFPNATATLWGPAATKLTGKRVRFFGSRGTSGRGRRFFFMQTADQAMPSLPATHKTYADKEYPAKAKTLGDGGPGYIRQTAIIRSRCPARRPTSPGEAVGSPGSCCVERTDMVRPSSSCSSGPALGPRWRRRSTRQYRSPTPK